MPLRIAPRSPGNVEDRRWTCDAHCCLNRGPKSLNLELITRNTIELRISNRHIMASASPLANAATVTDTTHWVSLLTNPQVVKLGIIFGVTPLVTIFLWFLVSYQTSPLKKYPGPFLAGWTNLWRLKQVISGEYAPRMKKLHEKYGPIVRIGPNLLDLDYPELSRIIYNTDGKWVKVNSSPSTTNTPILTPTPPRPTSTKTPPPSSTAK